MESRSPAEIESLLKAHIRTVPDFPLPGTMFRDITTLLGNAELFALTIDEMAQSWRDAGVTKVIVVESRGFIFGTPMAYVLKAGVVPVRKPGKLPAETWAEEYALEYGTNTLEIHQDALTASDRVLIVDDVLATGGTVDATIRLVRRFGAELVGVAVLAELVELRGRERIPGVDIRSLIRY